jgi:membrane fusion protein, heavy metal efflux system
MRCLFLLILSGYFSCRPSDNAEHSHESAVGHAHSDEGPPAEEYTVWTDKTELFVEFPILVSGSISRFAAHFTVLQGHRPVEQGQVTVSLVKGNKGIRHTVSEPSSPGIFGPALQPKEAGTYTLIFDLMTPEYNDQIRIDSVRVFGNISEYDVDGAPAEEEGGITFLKEQAWKIDFQTSPVQQKEIYQVISTSGVWKVAPSDYQTLIAPVSGRVHFNRSTFTEGIPVAGGQVLMTISSEGLTTNNINSEIEKAKADFDQAQAEYDRKKELSGIIPPSELEQVEQKYSKARITYETLVNGFQEGVKQVAVPFTGFIKGLMVTNGGYVEQGDALVTITSHKSSILETQVSPVYASELKNIQNLWYQPKFGIWSNLREKGGKILSLGREVDGDKPLLSLFYQVNEGIEMPEGSFTPVQIALGTPAISPVVPEGALLEDYGNYSVVVQLSGERFERREVTIGRRNGQEVEILNGLKTGEVIVTQGAYQVKMASMSSQVPAHGHTH